MNRRRQRWLQAVAVTEWTSPFIRTSITLRSTSKLFNRFPSFFFSLALHFINCVVGSIEMNRPHILHDKVLCLILNWSNLLLAKTYYLLWFICDVNIFVALNNADLSFGWNLLRSSLYKYGMFSKIICSARHLGIKRAVLHPFDYRACTSLSSAILLRPIILFFPSFTVHWMLFALSGLFRRCLHSTIEYASHLLKSYRYANEWLRSLALTHSLTCSLHI